MWLNPIIDIWLLREIFIWIVTKVVFPGWKELETSNPNE